MLRSSPNLSALVFGALLCASGAHATTIHVRANGSGDAPTIRAAAAAAVNGDTVLVESGVYYEDSIMVSKAILITGPPTDWPTINGVGEPFLIQIRPPGGTTIRNLILRNAGVGVMGRSEDCAAVSWSVDHLVLDSLQTGLDADNSFCRAGTAAWSNCTATRCDVAYAINDFGSVTGSRLVAMGCGTATLGHNYNSGAINCLVTYANGVNAAGPLPIALTNVIAADPLLCNLTQHDYHVATASPCLPANNSCGVQIGALGLGCAVSVAVDPMGPPLPAARITAWPVPSRGDVVFAMNQRAGLDRMQVYDLLGRQVWQGQANWAGGVFSWKPQDSAGNALAPGIYLAQFGSDRERTSVRFVLAQ